LETKIPRNINDLSQKGIMNLFQGKEVSLFGVKISKIVESLNVELQNIKIEERRTDLVFLLEDDSLLHLEFQTDYKQRDLTRFLIYDALIHEQHKQRKVTTVIIYSAGIKRKDFALNFETLIYCPYVIFLEEIDGDEILQELEDKSLNKQSFDVEDILNLLFNSFMKSDILEPEERAIRLIKVANAIEDLDVREMAKATTIGIMGKFLPVEQMMKLSEVLMMIDPLMALVNKVAEEVAEKKVAEKIAEKLDEKVAEKVAEKAVEKDLETAKKMLEKQLNVSLIAEITNLNLAVIEDLQLQL